jgi:hypothetical protein
MTDTARIKLAALVVAFFLASVSTAGVLSHTRSPIVALTRPVPSALHAHPVPTQISSLAFEHDNHD